MIKLGESTYRIARRDHLLAPTRVWDAYGMTQNSPFHVLGLGFNNLSLNMKLPLKAACFGATYEVRYRQIALVDPYYEDAPR